MKAKFLTLFVAVLLISAGSVLAQTSVSVETVDGLYNSDATKLTADGSTMITWSLRVTSDANVYTGVTNGFVVYSDDGATWGGTAGDTLTSGWAGATGAEYFDQFTIKYWSNDGAERDTVGFGGIKVFFGAGLPANFDEVAWSIAIGPIPAASNGKTICLDSCWYPPAGVWKWAASGGIVSYPAWDGPHCYTAVDPNASGVAEVNGDNLPTTYALKQNYPNPFNPTTTINFDIPTKSFVSIKVYNVLGQMVTSLVNEELDAGRYETNWDGAEAGSGIYFYKIQAGSFVETKKMMLLK